MNRKGESRKSEVVSGKKGACHLVDERSELLLRGESEDVHLLGVAELAEFVRALEKSGQQSLCLCLCGCGLCGSCSAVCVRSRGRRGSCGSCGRRGRGGRGGSCTALADVLLRELQELYLDRVDAREHVLLVDEGVGAEEAECGHEEVEHAVCGGGEEGHELV